MRNLFLLFVFFLISHELLPQAVKESASIGGFVYDAKNGEALIGANVFIKELGVGASANISGYFVITNIPNGEHILTASYVGYKSQSMKIDIVNDKSVAIKIYLESETILSREVIVTADSMKIVDKLFNKPISKVELTSTQINNIPRVVEADLLRSLQTLPGVQSLSDFSSALYIRGGTPDQNLYLIDGTDVYNPEHAFGLFSTFNTNAIKKAELMKGGFSAEYGGRLSSVLNVVNLDGNRNHFQGEMGISLLSGSATFQAPLWNLGSISGSFRRTYLDQTIAKWNKDIPNYYFYDGHVKSFLDLSDKDKVIVSFYGGEDNLDFKFDSDKEDSPGFQYRWGNVTGSVNWKRIIMPELFANIWITGSRFSSNFSFDEAKFKEENHINDLTFKGSFEYFYSQNLIWKFGGEYKNLNGGYIEEFGAGSVDISQLRNHYITYLTGQYRPIEKIDMEAGLRYDYFDGPAKYNDFSPRFSVKYRIDDYSNIKFSTGIYRQYLNRIPRFFMASIWAAVDENTKGSKSTHYILGYQRELFGTYEFEAEIYYKDFKDLYTFNMNMITEVKPGKFDDKGNPIYNELNGLFNRGDGRSYGLELFIRKDYGALTGWLGYSLSRTEAKVDYLNAGKYFAPRHDRTHTVNAVMNIDIGNFINELFDKPADYKSAKWIFGFNMIYATGQAITIPGSIYYVRKFPDWDDNQFGIALYPTELNTQRLPSYMRIDLSLTYEKDYGFMKLAPYIQVYNATNNKNVWFINYENEIKNMRIEPKIEYYYMLPILPSIGVNIKF